MPTAPKSIYDCFAQATMEISLNEAVYELKRDFNGENKIAQYLNSIGQTRFINLTHHFDEARVAFALYAGDGIVTKIIPKTFLGEKDMVYHLPSITSEEIDTVDHSFVVNTYPLVNTKNITQFNVLSLGDKIHSLGLHFTEGDNTPRNVGRLPDTAQTLVGIDSNMFASNKGGNAINEPLIRKWHSYIHELFPIYNKGAVPRQSDNTNFEFMSIHDHKTNLLSFDHQRENPIARRANDREKPREKHSFWQKLGLG